MNESFARIFKSIITGALGALFVTFIFLLISKPSTDDPLFYLSCYLGIIFGILIAWLSYRGGYISDFEQMFKWYPNGVICWELESRIIKSVENDYLDIGYSNMKKAVRLKKHIIDKNKEIIHAFELLKEKYPRGIKNTEAKFYGKYKIYILHHESEIEKAEEEERRREKIESLKNRFRDIEIIYPRGVKHWLEINNASKPLNDTQLQKISEEESLVRSYEEKSCKEEEIEIWKKEQQVFSKQCRKLRDEQLFGFGCYVYNIDINKYGVSTPERFPVWQMFAQEYCKEEDLDYTNYQSIENNKHSVESKIVVLSDKHSEKIVSFVDKLNNEEKTAIYFNPINYRNWSSNVYITTYNIILAKLSNRYRDIIYDPTEEVLMGHRPNFEEWKSNIERRVVVIDIATENDDLKTVCNKLINELAPIKPLITYISIQKCYDRNEMLDIIEKDKKKREEEEKERQRKLKEEEEKNRLRKLKEEEEKAKEEFEQHFSDLQYKFPCVLNGIPYYYFFNYYSKNYYPKINPRDTYIRRIIWRFKDLGGRINLSGMVSNKIISMLDYKREMLTFVCIPASTVEKHKIRYERFMKDVCQQTGMQNGYQYIKITDESEASHEGGSGCSFECDKDFFKGRKVIIFDDIITKGHSLNRMAIKLKEAGAEVVAAFFLGKTYYGRSYQSLPHPSFDDDNNPVKEWIIELEEENKERERLRKLREEEEEEHNSAAGEN